MPDSHEKLNDLEGASLLQRARVFLGRQLFRLGAVNHQYARMVVWAEIDNRLLKESGVDERDLIPPGEAAKLLVQMANTQASDRYALLAEPVDGMRPDPATGETRIWFDVIPGLTEQPIISGITRAAHDLLPPTKTNWGRAVDLGAGTGKLGSSLSGRMGTDRLAENITLVDQSNALLDVARQRYGSSLAYKVGEVTSLPFDDDSADLVVSSGLLYTLEEGQIDDYFAEVSRILAPEGVYLDADYADGRVKKQFDIGRVALMGNLVKNQVANELAGDPLEGVDQKSYFAQFGLKVSRLVYEDIEPDTIVTVRVLEKVAEMGSQAAQAA